MQQRQAGLLTHSAVSGVTSASPLSGDAIRPGETKNDFLRACPLISEYEAQTELAATALENWAQSNWKYIFTNQSHKAPFSDGNSCDRSVFNGFQ